MTSHADDTVSGAAPGGVTLFGSAHHSVTYSGGGNLFYSAGAGNETLNAVGSTGNDILFGSRTSGTHDRITAGSGADTTDCRCWLGYVEGWSRRRYVCLLLPIHRWGA